MDKKKKDGDENIECTTLEIKFFMVFIQLTADKQLIF
jgi:hypothetical protein